MRSYQPWLDNLNQEPGRVPFAWSNVWHWHNFWPPVFRRLLRARCCTVGGSAPGIGSIWSMVWMLTSLRLMGVGAPFLLPGCPCKGSLCRAVGHTMR